MSIFLRYVAVITTILIFSNGCSVIKMINLKSKNEPVAKEVLIFSPGDVINGLKLQTDYEICRDLVCLASLIDGAAPYYISNGSTDILFCDFKNSSLDNGVSVEIYKTSNYSYAKTFFDDSSSLSPVNINIEGNPAKIDEGLIGTYRIETYKQNYFIRVMTSEKDEESKKELIKFVEVVFRAIPD